MRRVKSSFSREGDPLMPRTSRRAVTTFLGILGICIATTIAQDRGDRAGSSASKGQPLSTKDISLDQAHAVLAAAVKKAQELKINQDIAVVDAGGNLKAFVRMDNAWLG